MKIDGQRSYAWPKDRVKLVKGLNVDELKTEANKDNESLAAFIDNHTNRIWMELFQQMILVADPSTHNPNERELRAFRSMGVGFEKDINIGEKVSEPARTNDSINSGMFKLMMMLDTHAKPPWDVEALRELRDTVKKDGPQIRYDDHNFFVIGMFSHEVGRGDRGTTGSFICLSFAETVDLERFVGKVNNQEILPSRFIAEVCTAGLSGLDKLTQDTNFMQTVISGIPSITLSSEKKMSKAIPFKEVESTRIKQYLTRCGD